MRRSPLRRKTAMRSAAPPRSGSRSAAWRSVRDAAFDRDRFSCQAARITTATRCDGPLDAHHLQRRSHGGTDDLANLITLCRAHHRWVHDHPAEAKALGLLL